MKRTFPLSLLLALLPVLGMGLWSSPVRADDEKPAPPRVLKTRDGSSMSFVPAGAFLRGDPPAKQGEAAARAREVVVKKGFYIDRTEVTNAQYRGFLDWVKEHGDATVRHAMQPAGKDHTPRYWKPYRPKLLRETGMARLQPFDDSTFRQDDHPVVGVDWFDAYAYARWAGKRLPTYFEWEKAARGTDGRIWPWGNEWHFGRCNSGGYEWKGEKDGFIYTAPVGSYPAGKSPYGCLDMAGNAWEWTAEIVFTSKSPDRPDTVHLRHYRVRGGGSNSYPSQVRAASSQVREPTFRSFAVGFRCAMDVPESTPEPKKAPKRKKEGGGG